MHMRAVVFLTIAALPLAGTLSCRGESFVGPSLGPTMSRLDIVVYTAAVDSLLHRYGTRTRGVALWHRVRSAGPAATNVAESEYLQKHGPIDKAALRAMASRSGDDFPAEDLVQALNAALAPLEVHLYSPEIDARIRARAKEINAVRRLGPVDDYWAAFYESYPGTSGRLSLSKIGYNKDASKAVLSFDGGCGGLCGEGGYIELTRAGVQWKVTRIVVTVVS